MPSLEVLITVLALVYILWARLKRPTGDKAKSRSIDTAHASAEDEGQSKDIIQLMENEEKNCVIFFASQSGTAENYALRLAKEGRSRFGLETMVASVEDYHLSYLDALPENKLAIFIMSTYGDGEPPDSAVQFFDFITSDDPSFSCGTSLSNLNYAAIGLGNKTYENYNAVIRKVTRALDGLGAHSLVEVGEADDGAGTTEEDFIAWKEVMWAACSKYMGASEHQTVFEPSFRVIESEILTTQSPNVYLGEPNQAHLGAKPNTLSGPFDASNPFLAPVLQCRELISSAEPRNCIHMDVSLANSGLCYAAGDHIAVWPSNTDEEVHRVLRAIGLHEKSSQVIQIESLDSAGPRPFPTPTTYDTLMRYYLEIGGQVSRQTVADIAPFAPTQEAKDELRKLGSDKDYFHQQAAYANIGRILERYGTGAQWTDLPFSLLIESIPKMQPRFYSIASSPRSQPNEVSITVAVKSEVPFGRVAEDPFCGVASNYILAVQQFQQNSGATHGHCQRYEINGPRQSYLLENKLHIPIYIRHSHFKLPKDFTRPIIMIGPGTGVAPFRGFVQERAQQYRNGEQIGQMMLFFGCRRQSEDFLYENEWKEYEQELGRSFKILTAFSRQGKGKVYVQHRLMDNQADVYRALENGAYVYVCGDGKHMAQDVSRALMDIISAGQQISRTQAEAVVKRMRNDGLYQEDVWA